MSVDIRLNEARCWCGSGRLRGRGGKWTVLLLGGGASTWLSGCWVLVARGSALTDSAQAKTPQPPGCLQLEGARLLTLLSVTSHCRRPTTLHHSVIAQTVAIQWDSVSACEFPAAQNEECSTKRADQDASTVSPNMQHLLLRLIEGVPIIAREQHCSSIARRSKSNISCASWAFLPFTL